MVPSRYRGSCFAEDQFPASSGLLGYSLACFLACLPLSQIKLWISPFPSRSAVCMRERDCHGGDFNTIHMLAFIIS